jgi:hypothetical protein
MWGLNAFFSFIQVYFYNKYLGWHDGKRRRKGIYLSKLKQSKNVCLGLQRSSDRVVFVDQLSGLG